MEDRVGFAGWARRGKVSRRCRLPRSWRPLTSFRRFRRRLAEEIDGFAIFATRLGPINVVAAGEIEEVGKKGMEVDKRGGNP